MLSIVMDSFNTALRMNLLKGPINVMVPFTAAAGILTYAWPFAQSKGSLISVTLLYGCVHSISSRHLLSNSISDLSFFISFI